MPPRHQITDAATRLAELEKDNSYMDGAVLAALYTSSGGVGDDLLGGGSSGLMGAAGGSSAVGGASGGTSSSKKAPNPRVHIGRAAAQHDKLFLDSMKIFRKVAERERKKANNSSSSSARRKGGVAAAASVALGSSKKSLKGAAASAIPSQAKTTLSRTLTGGANTSEGGSSSEEKKVIRFVPQGLVAVTRSEADPKGGGNDGAASSPQHSQSGCRSPPEAVITSGLASWLAGTFSQPMTVTGLPLGPSLAYLSSPSPQLISQTLALIGKGSAGSSRGGGGGTVVPAPLLCSICQLPALYTCPRCRVARYCSIECSDVHEEMRCNKFVA